ncbi:hypothetical protein AWB81_08453 [Caballeronia arationis]|jgi:hypothetical protein|nr:hypothetical protein AWB81_08453 [Caballeronia arationis]
MPAFGLNGSAKVVMTFSSWLGALRTLSQMDLPFTVSASLCNSPCSPSCFNTAGKPPA